MNFRYGGDVTSCQLRMYFQLRKKMHTTTYQTSCVELGFFSPLKIFIGLSKHRKTNITTKSLIQTNNTEAGGVNKQNMLNKEHNCSCCQVLVGFFFLFKYYKRKFQVTKFGLCAWNLAKIMSFIYFITFIIFVTIIIILLFYCRTVGDWWSTETDITVLHRSFCLFHFTSFHFISFYIWQFSGNLGKIRSQMPWAFLKK